MKPWDSRLAHLLVRPLRHTRVSPNHITTASLLVGLAASALYAFGSVRSADVGALLYCLAALLDHADGELARLTGKTTPFGHAYDRAVDLVVKIALFAGMGFGLRHGPLGTAAPFLGLLAGASLVAIFLLRSELARRRGNAALAQPRAGGFEIEDILYLIAPVTWLGGLQAFVVVAAAGAPLFALWTAAQLRSHPAREAGGAGERPQAEAMTWGVDPSLPVGEARKVYFAKAGFPADGGYTSTWVSLPIGPIPFGFPNTDSRRRAVPLHDIHHLATDYATTWTGEAEISGWELGAGCGRYAFAWMINLQGLMVGWLVDRGATWRAFVRGRHSRSLYREGYTDAVLREPLGALRSRLGLDRPAPTPRPGDYLAYAGCCLLAVASSAVVLALVVALVWLAVG